MIYRDITTARVITYKKIKSGKIIKSSQNGNQKWVSLFAVIYAVEAIISSTLIY